MALRRTFVRKLANLKGQGSGIVPNVYSLPTQSEAQKSARALGSDMDQLRITKVPVKLGQFVHEEEVLIDFELPLENRIEEKSILSKVKIEKLETTLASVDLRLAKLRLHQEELEQGRELKTESASEVSINQHDIDALLKQRAFVEEALALAREEYDAKLVIAQSKYGTNLDPKKIPHESWVRSPMDGYVLWMHPSLVPGMIFTKEASLITVGTLNPILVRAAVHEIDVQKLKVGDPATVVFRALPGETFHSTISGISFVAQPAMMQQPSFYEVKLSLPNPDLRIKEGLRYDVTVEASGPKP